MSACVESSPLAGARSRTTTSGPHSLSWTSSGLLPNTSDKSPRFRAPSRFLQPELDERLPCRAGYTRPSHPRSAHARHGADSLAHVPMGVLLRSLLHAASPAFSIPNARCSPGRSSDFALSPPSTITSSNSRSYSRVPFTLARWASTTDALAGLLLGRDSQVSDGPGRHESDVALLDGTQAEGLALARRRPCAAAIAARTCQNGRSSTS